MSVSYTPNLCSRVERGHTSNVFDKAANVIYIIRLSAAVHVGWFAQSTLTHHENWPENGMETFSHIETEVRVAEPFSPESIGCQFLVLWRRLTKFGS